MGPAAQAATNSRARARDSRSISRISPTVRGEQTGIFDSVSYTIRYIDRKPIFPNKNASTAISSAAFNVHVADPPVSWHW